jgi:hypothetical protein
VEDVDRGVARVAVLVEHATGCERDKGLSQMMLTAAEDGMSAAAARCGERQLELFASERSQGGVHEGLSVR